MKLTQPDGDAIYIDEPVSAIVDDVVEAQLNQGKGLVDAIQTGILTARMMEIEDDFFVGQRRTRKPAGQKELPPPSKETQ